MRDDHDGEIYGEADAAVVAKPRRRLAAKPSLLAREAMTECGAILAGDCGGAVDGRLIAKQMTRMGSRTRAGGELETGVEPARGT